MASTSNAPTYDTLVAEFSTLTKCHDASIAAARKAKADFLAADEVEVRLLKRSVECYEHLVTRSEAYRVHHRYVTRLCSRLLSWNHDINTRDKRQEPDEVEGLQYYTACYNYLTAASRLVMLNTAGKSTRTRAEVLHECVQRATARKLQCDEAGKEAYQLRNHWTEQAALFLAKLERFTYDGPPRGESLVVKMEQWMDDLDLRVRTAGEHKDAVGEWARVKETRVVVESQRGRDWKKDGKDEEVRLAEEERERVIRDLDQLRGKTSHEQCTFCEGRR